MNTLARSVLLVSFAACALPACAVETSSPRASSEAPSAEPSPAAGGLHDEMSECRADFVSTYGSFTCLTPAQANVPGQLVGGVSGSSDATYASTCSKRATIEAPVASCGQGEPDWSANLSLQVSSSLNATRVSALVCAASYLDYTVSIQTNGTTWSTYTSGRVYGQMNDGYCYLTYMAGLQDELGTLTEVEISADSYEVEDLYVPNAPPSVITTPMGVAFNIDSNGSPD